ncbi:MAG TPA: oligosaccharide flippase family protein [Verrucomicrobiae bacterium]|nr:oligosaccharide flippase family protein [Verrucomicrobiae bacterium]
MNLKQRVFRNSSLEMLSKIVGIGAGIFLSPYLIRSLTKETYGLWVLIGSVVGYFGFTDFGVRIAAGRLVAYYRARQDAARVNHTINTCLALLTASGFVVTLLTLLLSPYFGRLFHIGPDVPHVPAAVFLCGFAVAVGLPLTVFEGCLAGYERYDFINFVEIFLIIARVGLTVWMIQLGYGLLALAAINLALTMAGGSVKLLLCYRVFQPLHVTVEHIDRVAIRETYATSIWFLILAVSVRISFFTDNIVIGYFRTTGEVAVYSIAGRLAQYALVAVNAFNLVLMPVSAAYDAQANLAKQRRLLLLGTRASFAAAIFMATIFLAYGRQIVHIWIGSGFEQAAIALAILTFPMITQSSQTTTLIVMQGMAKHKTLSLIYLGEAIANLVLSLILVRPLGMIGVALGTALTNTLSSLIVQPLYVCRVLSLDIADYYRKAFLPVLLATVPLIALIAGFQYIWLPQKFITMAAFCILAAAFYFAIVYLLFFTKRALTRASFATQPPADRTTNVNTSTQENWI